MELKMSMEFTNPALLVGAESDKWVLRKLFPFISNVTKAARTARLILEKTNL